MGNYGIVTEGGGGGDGSNNVVTVADIAARDVLTPDAEVIVRVLDSSAAPEVTSGVAWWQWDGLQYQLVAEGESANIESASETTQGIVEIATSAEVQAGADASRVITPNTLANDAAVLLDGSGLKANAGKLDVDTDDQTIEKVLTQVNPGADASGESNISNHVSNKWGISNNAFMFVGSYATSTGILSSNFQFGANTINVSQSAGNGSSPSGKKYVSTDLNTGFTQSYISGANSSRGFVLTGKQDIFGFYIWEVDPTGIGGFAFFEFKNSIGPIQLRVWSDDPATDGTLTVKDGGISASKIQDDIIERQQLGPSLEGEIDQVISDVDNLLPPHVHADTTDFTVSQEAIESTGGGFNQVGSTTDMTDMVLVIDFKHDGSSGDRRILSQYVDAVSNFWGIALDPAQLGIQLLGGGSNSISTDKPYDNKWHTLILKMNDGRLYRDGSQIVQNNNVPTNLSAPIGVCQWNGGFTYGLPVRNFRIFQGSGITSTDIANYKTGSDILNNGTLIYKDIGVVGGAFGSFDFGSPSRTAITAESLKIDILLGKGLERNTANNAIKVAPDESTITNKEIVDTSKYNLTGVQSNENALWGLPFNSPGVTWDGTYISFNANGSRFIEFAPSFGTVAIPEGTYYLVSPSTGVTFQWAFGTLDNVSFNEVGPLSDGTYLYESTISTSGQTANGAKGVSGGTVLVRLASGNPQKFVVGFHPNALQGTFQLVGNQTYLDSTALETAFPAASNNGKWAIIQGATPQDEDGLWKSDGVNWGKRLDDSDFKIGDRTALWNFTSGIAYGLTNDLFSTAGTAFLRDNTDTNNVPDASGAVSNLFDNVESHNVNFFRVTSPNLPALAYKEFSSGSLVLGQFDIYRTGHPASASNDLVQSFQLIGKDLSDNIVTLTPVSVAGNATIQNVNEIHFDIATQSNINIVVDTLNITPYKAYGIRVLTGGSHGVAALGEMKGFATIDTSDTINLVDSVNRVRSQVEGLEHWLPDPQNSNLSLYDYPINGFVKYSDKIYKNTSGSVIAKGSQNPSLDVANWTVFGIDLVGPATDPTDLETNFPAASHAGQWAVIQGASPQDEDGLYKSNGSIWEKRLDDSDFKIGDRSQLFDFATGQIIGTTDKLLTSSLTPTTGTGGGPGNWDPANQPSLMADGNGATTGVVWNPSTTFGEAKITFTGSLSLGKWTIECPATRVAKEIMILGSNNGGINKTALKLTSILDNGASIDGNGLITLADNDSKTTIQFTDYALYAEYYFQIHDTHRVGTDNAHVEILQAFEITDAGDSVNLVNSVNKLRNQLIGFENWVSDPQAPTVSFYDYPIDAFVKFGDKLYKNTSGGIIPKGSTDPTVDVGNWDELVFATNLKPLVLDLSISSGNVNVSDAVGYDASRVNVLVRLTGTITGNVTVTMPAITQGERFITIKDADGNGTSAPEYNLEIIPAASENITENGVGIGNNTFEFPSDEQAQTFFEHYDATQTNRKWEAI